MKLSEIKGERVFDVLAESAEPLGKIISDEAVKAALQADGSMAEKLPELVKVVCSKHRDNIVAVLSVINGKTPEEYKESMTVSSLINDVMEFVTDEDAIAFLS